MHSFKDIHPYNYPWKYKHFYTEDLEHFCYLEMSPHFPVSPDTAPRPRQQLTQFLSLQISFIQNESYNINSVSVIICQHNVFQS